jgi:hypothetical protein
VPGWAGTGGPARWGIALVEAAIGYEWVVSALDKIASAQFVPGLQGELRKTLRDNPNHWYSDLLGNAILPHVHLFAFLVEIGELLVGLGFFVGALLWLSNRISAPGWPRVLNCIVIVALAGGALMTANYYLKDGNTLPGLDPGNPYNEGLTIDGLLTLVALALVVAHVMVLFARRSFQRADSMP